MAASGFSRIGLRGVVLLRCYEGVRGPSGSSPPSSLALLVFLDSNHKGSFEESVLTLPTIDIETMAALADLVPAGVLTGDDLVTLFDHARANGYAIPAVNCTR
jgi:hypothetical protein